RGEALGVGYHGETINSMLAQLRAVEAAVCSGSSREQLTTLLPPGGARNAVDCALWDLEAKRLGKRAWQIAGLSSMKPVTTDYTIGLDAPEVMARVAATLHQFPILKLKLCGEDDLER